MERISFFWLYLLILILIFHLLYSPAYPSSKSNEIEKAIFPTFASKPPKIDGVLDDEVWQNPPLDVEFITYRPRYGETFPQKTFVWTAYDDKNLYFAFYCFDQEPEKIKTSITKRDNIFNDDWVGLSLDTMGTKQSSYNLFVNPNGIQADELNSAVSGEDSSPDWVWESAAKLSKDGYQVEICLPLKSIRFKSGSEVQMGILFWRGISRLGMSGTWPGVEPGSGVLTQLATIVYKNLKNSLNLEFLPDVTFGSKSQRNSEQEWKKSENFRDFGIGFKYGITTSLTADIAINPDFSQVESDSFQIEVNRRYPVFYSEKRPFFMEGADIFNFATISYGFLRTPVHTRKILDPLWGAKLTGTIGKTAIGIITACDEWTPIFWDDSSSNSYEGKNAYFTIVRGKYGLGKDSYLGSIYSSRVIGSEYNHVCGTDLILRFSKNHQIKSSLLASYSKEKEEKSESPALDFNFMYAHETKHLGIMAAFEHIDTNFRMDSAFLMRTGISHGWLWIGPNFYPHLKKIPWLMLISPQLTFQYIHDIKTKMNDGLLRVSSQINFTRQGALNIAYTLQTESWAYKSFDKEILDFEGKIQLTNWLHLGAVISTGDQIYYFSTSPYLGKEHLASFSLTLQPSAKLNLSMNLEHSGFWKSQEKVYEVNIFYTRATYQFSKYFFVRAIAQYNSFQSRMLTDFLASFTFIPGTVIHLGYGGLYEKSEGMNDGLAVSKSNLINTERSIFFKASYLWRF